LEENKQKVDSFNNISGLLKYRSQYSVFITQGIKIWQEKTGAAFN